jgi:hypothetical protein
MIELCSERTDAHGAQEGNSISSQEKPTCQEIRKSADKNRADVE